MSCRVSMREPHGSPIVSIGSGTIPRAFHATSVVTCPPPQELSRHRVRRKADGHMAARLRPGSPGSPVAPVGRIMDSVTSRAGHDVPDDGETWRPEDRKCLPLTIGVESRPLRPICGQAWFSSFECKRPILMATPTSSRWIPRSGRTHRSYRSMLSADPDVRRAAPALRA